MKRIFPFIALALASGPLIAGNQTDYGSASVAAPWLKLPVSARAWAMGGAYAAIAEGPDAISLNPAGLSQMKNMEASLMHDAWFQGMAAEHAAFGMPLGTGSGAAASVDYLDFGSIDGYDVVNNLPVATGSFTPTAARLDLAYGRALGQGFSAGLNAKALFQNIDGQSDAAGAADLGILWKPQAQGLSLGAALQNMGGQLDGATLPQNLVLGACWSFNSGPDSFKGAAQIEYPLADAKALSLSVGEEYWFRGAAGLRLGYKYQDHGALPGLTGLTGGLGGRYRGLELDYTFIAMGDLGNGNLISLGLDF